MTSGTRSGTPLGIIRDPASATLTDVREKVRGNRVRRLASRQGLHLRKSRRRDRRALDYNRWTIVDAATHVVLAGQGPTGRPSLTLEEVEAYLEHGPTRTRQMMPFH